MKKPPERVSIKYSVDFREVPERVRLMLVELANSYSGISTKTREISNKIKPELVESLQNLTELSDIVAKSKIRIDDCTSILLGYVEILQEIAKEMQEVEKQQKAASSAPEKEKTTKKKKTKKKKATKKKEDK